MAKSKRRSKKSAGKAAGRPAMTEREIDKIIAEAERQAEKAAKEPKLTRSQVAAERIEDEYSHITEDLRRVFILAAAMFALLIALNIILRFVEI